MARRKGTALVPAVVLFSFPAGLVACGEMWGFDDLVLNTAPTESEAGSADSAPASDAGLQAADASADASCVRGSCSCPLAPACSPGATCRSACNLITCSECGQWPATCGGTCTTTFRYTGAPQSFTVPDGISQLTVTVAGAQAGAFYFGPAGGRGGSVTATFTVTPGETLGIYVGGTGTVAPAAGSAAGAGLGGWNGGANGGGTWYYGSGGGGGGGASDIRRGGSALANRIILAGGGGGASGTQAGAAGGAGGNTAGGNGAKGDGGMGGFGGGQSAGGAGGTGTTAAGTAGRQGIGGAGGNGYASGGGGGGGGYYGGGGGGGYYIGGGGGGGSSYVLPSATGVALQAGVRTGNGQIVVSYE